MSKLHKGPSISLEYDLDIQDLEDYLQKCKDFLGKFDPKHIYSKNLETDVSFGYYEAVEYVHLRCYVITK